MTNLDWSRIYCTPSSLLNYPYFKKYYDMIEIDLSKQKVIDADPKAIQKIWKSISTSKNIFHY